eukprot:gene31718-39983_t
MIIFQDGNEATDVYRHKSGRLCFVSLQSAWTFVDETGALKAEKRTIRMGAIYGITGGSTRELGALEEARLSGSLIAIGGDFNCVEDPAVDAVGDKYRRRERSLLSAVLADGLLDFHRLHRPMEVLFTRTGKTGGRARLDYILVGEDRRILPIASAFHKSETLLSDHDSPLLDLLGAQVELEQPDQHCSYVRWRNFLSLGEAARASKKALAGFRQGVRDELFAPKRDDVGGSGNLHRDARCEGLPPGPPAEDPHGAPPVLEEEWDRWMETLSQLRASGERTTAARDAIGNIPINRRPPPTTLHFATAASGSSATAATSDSASESAASSRCLHFELAEENPAVLEWSEDTERTWAEDLADIAALEFAEREHTRRKRMLLEGLVHLLFLGLLPLEGGSLATLRAVHPALRHAATHLIRSLHSIESTVPGRAISFPSTTSLELCSCDLAGLDMMELSGLRHLTHLDILGCSDLVGGGLPALALFQHLAFLGLRGQNLHAATPPIGWTSASSLLALDLGQTDVADACANAILRGHPRLVSLDLSSCPRLTGGGLLDGVWPSALSTLSLRDCPLLRDACIVEVTRLRGICSLDIGMCEEVTDEGALAISGMRSL